MTRSRFPSQEIIEKGLAVFKNFNISTENLQQYNQHDCFTEPFKSSVSLRVSSSYRHWGSDRATRHV